MNKLFTHTDLDGVGCAVLAEIAFWDDVDISYCNYDDIDLEVEKFFNNVPNDFTHCFITDISINNELANGLNKSVSSEQIVLLDHHPTAFELNKYNWCHVIALDVETGLKTCGTELYYKWLVENSYLNRTEVLDTFVTIVRDYDTWRWAELGEEGKFAKQFNDLLYIYGREDFIDWCVYKINENTIHEIDEFSKSLLNRRQKEIDAYIDKKNSQLYITEFISRDRHMTCGVVFAESYFSELGNTLSEWHPELDFIAMIDISSGKISYRTAYDGLDLGVEVASLLGGGGHPKASGSTFKNDISHELINKLLTPPTGIPNVVNPHQELFEYVMAFANTIMENAEDIARVGRCLEGATIDIKLPHDGLPSIKVDMDCRLESILKLR